MPTNDPVVVDGASIDPVPAQLPPVSPAPAPATNPSPVSKPMARQSPESRWLSLQRWADSRGLGPVRRVTAGPVESFALMANAGGLTLNVGSLSTRWNNLEIRLGFAPQLVDGQVFVHWLDLQKNIEPLVRGFIANTNPARLVVLDPGHGGLNTGTRSVADGRDEKLFTLDWALRLAPLLEANGWRVLLTRTQDVDVSLDERVAFAEEQRADLFLSLHFNSTGGGSREAAGLETFCLTPSGMVSSLTRGDDDDPSQLFPNNAYDEQNVMYAVRLHAALLKLNGYVDRGVRRARFLTVLQGQNRPAVLIEGGFLSNPAEARRIGDPAFRQRLAEAVAAGLK
jgi:N-acetylmuramoyl-L-alanine amidase